MNGEEGEQEQPAPAAVAAAADHLFVGQFIPQLADVRMRSKAKPSVRVQAGCLGRARRGDARSAQEKGPTSRHIAQSDEETDRNDSLDRPLQGDRHT